jgi:hypothetical protein
MGPKQVCADILPHRHSPVLLSSSALLSWTQDHFCLLEALYSPAAVICRGQGSSPPTPSEALATLSVVISISWQPAGVSRTKVTSLLRLPELDWRENPCHPRSSHVGTAYGEGVTWRGTSGASGTWAGHAQLMTSKELGQRNEYSW